MSTVPALFWTLVRRIVLVLVFWPVRVARRKGRNIVGFFILSIVSFPLALILAYWVSDKSEQQL